MDDKKVWKNVISNLAAIAVFAQATYPTLSGETLLASIYDGSILPKALNLALVYLLYNHGKDDVKIRYVVDED